MGKPTWILLPNVCDWRWIPEEPESPWYPGARLYWQPGVGRWPDAIARVAQDLAAYRAPPRAAARMRTRSAWPSKESPYRASSTSPGKAATTMPAITARPATTMPVRRTSGSRPGPVPAATMRG